MTYYTESLKMAAHHRQSSATARKKVMVMIWSSSQRLYFHLQCFIEIQFFHPLSVILCVALWLVCIWHVTGKRSALNPPKHPHWSVIQGWVIQTGVVHVIFMMIILLYIGMSNLVCVWKAQISICASLIWQRVSSCIGVLCPVFSITNKTIVWCSVTRSRMSLNSGASRDFRLRTESRDTQN